MTQNFMKKLEDAERRDNERLKLSEITKKYMIDKMISKGSFSKVIKARFSKFDTFVAIKLMNHYKLQKREIFDIFKNEVCILKILSVHESKHTISYVDHGIFQNQLAIVMELGNNSLRNFMTRLLRLELISEIIQQLVIGVRYMHSLHVSHRDLKPDNVLICQNTIKICDFGFSCNSSQNPQIRRHTICGTLPYMAPEIFIHRKLGYRVFPVDVWAIGVISYELIHKSLAFEGRTLKEMKIKIMNGVHRPFKIGLPQVFMKFVDECLIKNPTKRPNIYDIKYPQKKSKLIGDDDKPS